VNGAPDGSSGVQAGLQRADSLIYLASALLLVVAAGFTLVGTAIDIVEGSDSRAITDTGVFLLERVLLLFIIAELLYTLRLVDAGGGRILVEPFLFIGLIAVVRRVLVVTAEAELEDRTAVTDFAIEIGALAGLALVLALALHFLRRSAPQQP
jgi:uncharacterized membrane protein (DUF373 family)